MRGLFITGTDTGIGKTALTCAILRGLRSAGRDAVGFKPAAAGVERLPAGPDGAERDGWSDAEALLEASGGTACGETIETLCPIRLRAPLAPHLAARAEGRQVNLDEAWRALNGLGARHEVVVAEGAGGLLVPLDERTTVLDFILAWGRPVVVVAHDGLGTINHTALTVRELQRSGAAVAGVVLNAVPGTAPQEGSAGEIERLTGVRVLARLPRVECRADEPAERSAELLRALMTQVDVDRLPG
jgi:dethiobiotin synthetase